MIKPKIQSIHFDADQKLIDFIQAKMDKLGHYYDRIIDSEIYLRLDKNGTNENKIAEIKIAIPGHDFFAKKQCKTFEEATDTAVDALKKQLTKYKGKLRKVA